MSCEKIGPAWLEADSQAPVAGSNEPSCGMTSEIGFRLSVRTKRPLEIGTFFKTLRQLRKAEAYEEALGNPNHLPGRESGAPKCFVGISRARTRRQNISYAFPLLTPGIAKKVDWNRALWVELAGVTRREADARVSVQQTIQWTHFRPQRLKVTLEGSGIGLVGC